MKKLIHNYTCVKIKKLERNEFVVNEGHRCPKFVNKKEYTWSRFFLNEWRNDGLLQSCFLVTKGFWVDILCLMFNSERRGYLQVNGRPMTVLEISKMIHCDICTVKRQIEMLKERNVCSIDEKGVIYSRRMAYEYKDENDV